MDWGVSVLSITIVNAAPATPNPSRSVLSMTFSVEI